MEHSRCTTPPLKRVQRDVAACCWLDHGADPRSTRVRAARRRCPALLPWGRDAMGGTAARAAGANPNARTQSGASPAEGGPQRWLPGSARLLQKK